MVTQKEVFYTWLLNERDRTEQEVVKLQQKLRYTRNIDAVDCMELSLALERLSCFNDFFQKSIAIFKLSLPVDLENAIYFDVSDLYRQAAENKKRLKKEIKGE